MKIQKSQTSEKEPLNITTQHYFFKPLCAHLYSFALRAYDYAGCRLISPALDVGCGDGTFGSMLTSMLGQSLSLVGIDIGVLNRRKMEHLKAYSMLIQSNATNLPFGDGSFSTVFSNFVLPVIKDLPAAIREIRRVLSSDGQFYCTVRTNLFREYYLIARLLRRLGCKRAAELYMDRVDKRFNGVTVSFSATKWIDAFTEEGLRVQKIVGFYPLTLMNMWSLLALTPMRLFGLLQLIPYKAVHRLSMYLQHHVFSKTYMTTPIDVNPKECAFIMICANKQRA